MAIKDCILFLKLTEDIEKKHYETARRVFPPKKFDQENKLQR